MKSKNNSKRIIIIIVLLLLLVGVFLAVFFVYKKISNKPNPTKEISQQSTATNTENSDKANTVNAPVNSNSSTLQAPTITKSSGNNGSVPVNVLINFVCNSQPNTTCQLILIDGSKKITLEEKPVIDNGRGQFFASWDWKSIAGNWQVFVRAKNQQGNTADSIKQSLVVE